MRRAAALLWSGSPGLGGGEVRKCLRHSSEKAVNKRKIPPRISYDDPSGRPIDGLIPMHACVSEKLIGIAATVTRAIEAPAGGTMSATHAALLASRLFEAIKAERAALEPGDVGTKALLDHAIADCRTLACAGERLPARLRAVFALLAGASGAGDRQRRQRTRRSDAPSPQLRLFRTIEGGRAAHG